MYKVLWFDDEFETLEEIVEDFLDNDIEIIGVSNAEDGILRLKESPNRFDAVLLDGMFFNNSKQYGEVNDSAFGEVVMELNILKSQGIILPWFILSGQPNFVKERSAMIEMLRKKAYADGKVFDKLEDKSILCNAIKRAADESPLTKVRQLHPEAFKSFELGILDSIHERLLLDVLVCYNEGDFRKKNNNVQRDLLEAIWKALHFNIPCIPESFFDSRLNDKPNHEWCTLYFENRPVRNNQGEHRIGHFIPKGIGSAFRGLKESVNELSHLNDEEMVKLPYTTNTHLLITILDWLPEFVQEHYPNYI